MMKEIIEKGTMITPNKEEAPYIITMDKIANDMMIIEAKNEKNLHIFSYVNMDIEVYILGIVKIIFQYLEESILENRIQINIKLFYEKKDNECGEIVRRSYRFHIEKEKNKNIEDTIQYIKSELRRTYEVYGILLIKDIKIQFICCGEPIIEEE